VFYKTHFNIIVFFLIRPEKNHTHKQKHTLCIYLYVYWNKSKYILKCIFVTAYQESCVLVRDENKKNWVKTCAI